MITDNLEEKVWEGVQIACECGEKWKGIHASSPTVVNNVDIRPLIQVLRSLIRSRENVTLEI